MFIHSLLVLWYKLTPSELMIEQSCRNFIWYVVFGICGSSFGQTYCYIKYKMLSIPMIDPIGRLQVSCNYNNSITTQNEPLSTRNL